MKALLNALGLTFLRSLTPERAHGLAIRALAAGFVPSASDVPTPRLAVSALGLDFPNPVGLAAGFDKNADAGLPILALGFGFVETGTVTPRPQIGNTKPRIFRLTEDNAVINRLGFNNKGLDAYLRNLAKLRDRPIVLGANIGINKEQAVPLLDYPHLVRSVAPFVDYVVVNVSSPNTPGLRDLQSEEQLTAILQAISKITNRPPVLVKIAPDLSEEGLASLVETCANNQVHGLIVSNTTITRPATLRSAHASQTGGLSGAPLRQMSTKMLARTYQLARGRLELIGVGGISTGADVLEKIQAGASLVQLYTSFAYQGPALIPRLKQELLQAMDAQNITSISDAIGTRAASLAERA
jgi:dihydroorotate dehydrogenase